MWHKRFTLSRARNRIALPIIVIMEIKEKHKKIPYFCIKWLWRYEKLGYYYLSLHIMMHVSSWNWLFVWRYYSGHIAVCDAWFNNKSMTNRWPPLDSSWIRFNWYFHKKFAWLYKQTEMKKTSPKKKQSRLSYCSFVHLAGSVHWRCIKKEGKVFIHII